MKASKISTNRQVVVPRNLRDAVQLQPEDEVSLHVEGQSSVLQRVGTATASLLVSRDGRKVLIAPQDAPEMNADTVKSILADFP